MTPESAHNAVTELKRIIDECLVILREAKAQNEQARQ
jgi:hypothetical protein